MNGTRHEERRQNPRVEHHDHITVERLSTETRLSAQLMNISAGGAKLVCDCSLEPGETLSFNADAQSYQARVLECSKRFNGYTLRTEFIA
ncbi:MAG: PilZ domain-containing protein [Planctomycetota bacterium]|jgi:c-di-GMP-binding flagellar brake protein YcgR